MMEPKRDELGPQSIAEVDGTDFTQEIESPLDDFTAWRVEPAMTRIDFDEAELTVDL
jgi:hypothetical protein